MTATLPDTHAAFLNSIRGLPTDDHATRVRLISDDAPRLVFADWLEENGEPERGEFIRVQVELAAIGHNHPNLEWLKDNRHNNPCRQCLLLHARERELSNGIREWSGLSQPWSVWYRQEHIAGGGPHALFTRGFISHVTTTMAMWAGRTCRRCGGSGTIGDYDHIACPDCKLLDSLGGGISSGRTPDHGPAIVRAAASAVEAVALTNLEPWHPHPSSLWYWFDAATGNLRTDEHPQSEVPNEIWELMSLRQDTTGRKVADSEADALDAISVAAIKGAWK